MEVASAPQLAQGRSALDFFAHMAQRGMDPANLYAALRGARQLGKGLFVAAVQSEGLEAGEAPVGTKACRKYLPPVAPGPCEKVAQHLPPGVRADVVFREYQKGGRDAIFHIRRQFGLSRPQVKFMKSRNCLALLLLYVHPTEGVQGMHLRFYTKGDKINPLLREGADRDLENSIIAGLSDEGAALAKGMNLDTKSEGMLPEEVLPGKLERTFMAWFDQQELTEAQTPPARSAAAGAASSAPVAAPSRPGEPTSAETATTASRLDAEIAESNLAVRRKKEAAKRGHKKLQPALTEARAHAMPPLPQPALPDDGKQDGGLPRNKSRRPKKAVDKKGPGPSEFELEREMSKLRALAQQHLATAPPLDTAEPSPPAPARRRKTPQGDAKLARRVAAADLL